MLRWHPDQLKPVRSQQAPRRAPPIADRPGCHVCRETKTNGPALVRGFQRVRQPQPDLSLSLASGQAPGSLQIRRPLSDHESCRVGGRAGNLRHDREVCDAQPLDAVNVATVIDHGIAV